MPKKDITTDDVTSLAKNLLINRLPVVNVCSQVNIQIKQRDLYKKYVLLFRKSLMNSYESFSVNLTSTMEK